MTKKNPADLLRRLAAHAACGAVLSVLALSTWAPAQAADAKVAEAKADAALTIDSLATTLSRHEIVSGTFTQERVMKGFPKPLKSEGTFVFAAGRGVLWATVKPFPSEVLLSEKALSTTNGFGTETLSANDLPQLEVVNRFVMELVSGRFGALDEAFTTVLTGSAADWRLHLTPKDGFAKAVFISIDVSGNDYPRTITLVTRDGQETRVFLADQTPLKDVPEALRNLK